MVRVLEIVAAIRAVFFSILQFLWRVAGEVFRIIRAIAAAVFSAMWPRRLKIIILIGVFLLAILPLLLFDRFSVLQSIELSNEVTELDFLAVIIALAAYVAAVRLALISRLSGGTRAKRITKLLTLALIPADFNLIVSGAIMAGKVFLGDLLGDQWIGILMPYVPVLFAYAVLYLALQHVLSWIISIVRFL